MLGVSADDKHCVTVDGKVVVGRQPRHRAGVYWRAQVSPTRPEQPSLASLGGGMAAGAAFAHPRAADARVRPIFLRRNQNVTLLSHIYRIQNSRNEPVSSHIHVSLELASRLPRSHNTQST